MTRHVILGLLRDGRARHGYELMTELKARSDEPISTGHFYRELARMAALAKQRAIPMVVIIIPARAGVEAIQARSIATHLDYDLPARFVRTRLDALRVPFVDLTPLFARHPVDQVFFGHDLHFTPFGHRLVADAVRPLVERSAGPRTNP